MTVVKRGVYIDVESKELYEILGLTKNLDNLEELVLYRPVKTSDIKDDAYYFVESVNSFAERTNPESKQFRLVYLSPPGVGD